MQPRPVPSRGKCRGDKQSTKGFEMKTCETCKNWIDATAECALQLAGKLSDESVLDLDKNEENKCSEYRFLRAELERSGEIYE